MTRFLTVLALSATGLFLTASDASAFGGRRSVACAPVCHTPCAPVCHTPCPAPCHNPCPAPCYSPCHNHCPTPCVDPCGRGNWRLFGGGLFNGGLFGRRGCGC